MSASSCEDNSGGFVCTRFGYDSGGGDFDGGGGGEGGWDDGGVGDGVWVWSRVARVASTWSRLPSEEIAASDGDVGGSFCVSGSTCSVTD